MKCFLKVDVLNRGSPAGEEKKRDGQGARGRGRDREDSSERGIETSHSYYWPRRVTNGVGGRVAEDVRAIRRTRSATERGLTKGCHEDPASHERIARCVDDMTRL